MSDPNAHQNLQPFPRLNSPIADPETGMVEPPWYRFLIGIWQRLGGSSNSFPSSVFGQQIGSGVDLFNAATGEDLGTFQSTNITQLIPIDSILDTTDDTRQALMLSTPADSLDPDQIVLASLARSVPAD